MVIIRDAAKSAKKERQVKLQLPKETKCEPWRNSAINAVMIDTPAAAMPIA